MYATPQQLDQFFGHSFDDLRMLNKTLELIATMNELRQAQIVFDANGGTINGQAALSVIAREGTRVIFPMQSETQNGTRPLLGWVAEGTNVGFISPGGQLTPAIPNNIRPPGSSMTVHLPWVFRAVWGGQ